MNIPQKIAILRVGAVGDVLLTTPALEALKKALPKVHVVYVTKAAMAPLISSNPFVDEVLPLAHQEGHRSIAQRIKEKKCDFILDLHGKIRSQLIRLHCPGIPYLGWKKRPLGLSIPVGLGLRRWTPKTLLADRFHRAVESMVGRPLERGKLRATLSEGAEAEAQSIFDAQNISNTRPILGLCPGAAWASKQWPISHFTELAERAVGEGFEVMVVGSTGESPLVEYILQRVPSAKAAHGSSLAGLVALIARCDVFVANDSGPMHIARGFGIPTVAHFGSTPASQFDFSGHAVQDNHQPCAPCHFYGRRRCPKGHFRCMRDLTASESWESVLRIKGKKPLPLLPG